MPQTNGSSRLRIGNTDVLVGIKLEVDTPFPDSPNTGKLEFFVDCSAVATPEFEGKGGEDLATEIANTLSRSYQSSSTIDLKILCILPHKKCWKMYIDVLILQCGGNLFDAIGVAVKAALYSTEIPKVTAATLDGGEADIQVSDDPFDCIKLNVNNYPLLVTMCKIGDNCIVDPTAEEEACSSCNIILSVTPKGRITSILKTGHGSLQPTTMLKNLEIGTRVAKNLNEGLMEALNKEESLGTKRQIAGFLR